MAIAPGHRGDLRLGVGDLGDVVVEVVQEARRLGVGIRFLQLTAEVVEHVGHLRRQRCRGTTTGRCGRALARLHLRKNPEQVVGVLCDWANDRRSRVGIGCADGLQWTIQRIVTGEAGARGGVAANLRGLYDVAIGVVIVFDCAHTDGGRRTGARAGARGGDAAQFAVAGLVPIGVEHAVAVGILAALGPAVDIAMGEDLIAFLIHGADGAVGFVILEGKGKAVGVGDLDRIAGDIVDGAGAGDAAARVRIAHPTPAQGIQMFTLMNVGVISQYCSVSRSG